MLRFSVLFIFSFISLITSLTAHAEIYQWTDEHGQTHFGDRAPNTSAKDISNQVNQINIASDLSSPEMMLQQAKEKEKIRAQQQDKQSEKADKKAHMERCKEMKKALRTVNRPVIFVDQNGKDMKWSESQRKLYASDLQKKINQDCQ